MAPTFVAFLSTLVAACVLMFLTPLRPFVPFPELDPNPLPAEISAAVAEARDQRQTAEDAQRKAERGAAQHFGSLARLTIEANGMRTRLREANARVAALQEMSLPTAIEMVAKMGQAATDEGGDDGEAGAATAYRPKPPAGPR